MLGQTISYASNGESTVLPDNLFLHFFTVLTVQNWSPMRHVLSFTHVLHKSFSCSSLLLTFTYAFTLPHSSLLG